MSFRRRSSQSWKSSASKRTLGFRRTGSTRRRFKSVWLKSRAARRPEPNFIVLLGHHYGWRPLSARIQNEEFETVLADIGETSERVDCDLNANPPENLLKSRKGIYTE
jgi:hypothetical protein